MEDDGDTSSEEYIEDTEHEFESEISDDLDVGNSSCAKNISRCQSKRPSK